MFFVYRICTCNPAYLETLIIGLDNCRVVYTVYVGTLWETYDLKYFYRVLDESRKIDAYLNERDKDHSDLIKNLANEVRKVYSTGIILPRIQKKSNWNSFWNLD